MSLARVIERGAMREIVLPEAKPAYEWILGRAVQKVSPRRAHALLQAAFSAALSAWAEGRGEVGTEWEFRPAPPGEERRPLVPDVAFVSFERVHGLSDADREKPPFAPDVAVEVRSPSDREQNIDEKVRVYLAAGARLVVLVDPQAGSITAIDADEERTFLDGDVLAHPALPGFSLPLDPFFARIA
ncbi:MAG TPA: Uma2 family endonuclease [Candidatus Acidoferrum sp.]|jgi:Uma2 family endonuclease|nr:Uma2 family endonuclease [Candidatus Acidoferrum sp.]